MSRDFDDFSDSYGDAVQRSIAFSGQDQGFFTDVKADLLVDLAARHVGDPASLSVLDVGCGVGLTDEAIGGRFGTLAGVDVSAGSIEAARRRGPGIAYRVYDGAHLPFPADGFDLAFAICVLHHVDPPGRAAFVAEMARVVRPGGCVFVVEHNPFNPLTRLAVARCDFDEGVVLAWRSRTDRLLAAAGLTRVASPYVLFFPWRAAMLRRTEARLGWLPLGAQYISIARRPPGASAG
jgi:SAM-dependent methyltransferase